MTSESASRIRSVPVKQQSSHPKTDLPRDRHRQSQLHDYDVLVQSGQLSETPAGSQNFQRLVQLNVALYEATRSRTERYYITQSIVRSIRHEGGRFLQYVSAWPRHTSSVSDENPPNPDDSIWILKEMTDEQAETFTAKALEEAIHKTHEQQRSQDIPRVYLNNHDNPNLSRITRQVNSRQKIAQSATSSHRKPFRVLQPQHPVQCLEQEKPRLLQESRLAESEYGNDIEVRQDDDDGIHDDDLISSIINQENNPMLVVGNHGTTSTPFPPSPPAALRIMSAKAAWTVSPIRNQRKRLRVDTFDDTPPASPSTIPCLRPTKRRRHDD